MNDVPSAHSRFVGRRCTRPVVVAALGSLVLVVVGAGVLIATRGGPGQVNADTASRTTECETAAATPRPARGLKSSEDVAWATPARCDETAQEAVGATMAGLDTPLLSDARIAPAPTYTHESTPWFDTTFTALGRQHRFLAAWEAEAAEGAVAERMTDGQLTLSNVVGGLRVTNDRDVNGTGQAASGQVFDAQREHLPDAVIVDEAKQTLGAYGLTPVTVDVLHPFGPALEVVAEVRDPDVLKGRWSDLGGALFGTRFEAGYLEVRDASGTQLASSSFASRNATGSVTFAPGIDSLWGIEHGALATPPGPRPPAVTFADVAAHGRGDAWTAYTGPTPRLTSYGALGELQEADPRAWSSSLRTLGLHDLRVDHGDQAPTLEHGGWSPPTSSTT